jgi:hypothetical protein
LYRLLILHLYINQIWKWTKGCYPSQPQAKAPRETITIHQHTLLDIYDADWHNNKRRLKVTMPFNHIQTHLEKAISISTPYMVSALKTGYVSVKWPSVPNLTFLGYDTLVFFHIWFVNQVLFPQYFESCLFQTRTYKA